MKKNSKGLTTDKTEEICNININGDCLEEVHHYVYLGSTLRNNGERVTEIKNTLGLATSKLMNMKPLQEGLDTTQTKLGY